ncbi:MAG TPA: hypothetical protein GXX40_02965 [Firmicutes bacterium]|nr:hypothetical protein [Bacillota bacterium]
MMASREMQELIRRSSAYQPRRVRARGALRKAVFYLMFGYLAFSFISRGIRLHNTLIAKEEVEQQIKFYEEQVKQLKAKIDEVNSAEFIEKEARQQLGLVKPGEIQFIIKEVQN